MQEHLTYREILIWWAYREKYGPLNPVRMYDQGAAYVATQVNRMRGGKAVPMDFMPFCPRPEEKTIETADDFVTQWGGGLKIGR